MLRNKILFQFLITLFFLSIPVCLSALNLNEVIVLKKNGSGTLTVYYTAKETVIKSKNSQIGNFPFIQDKISEYFTSPTTIVFSSKVEKHPEDNTVTRVSVTIGFNNITKLNEMKAFSDMNIIFQETDTGSVLRYFVTTAFIKTNSLDNFYFILTPESAVKSTNGKIENKSITFFRGKEYIDGKSDIIVNAVLESGGISSGDQKDGQKDNEGKSCGLFGLELPVIILFGTALLMNRKKKFY